MARPIRCVLKVLSPLHLGCDEVYETLSFVLDRQKQRLIVFEPWEFYSRMSPQDRQQFSAICCEGTVASLQKIYKFFQDKSAVGREVGVCPGLLEHYEKTLRLSPQEFQKELNRFTIARTAFRAQDQRPYLPGSAIKGAWRTAYLNQQERSKRLAPVKQAKELEKALLDGGSFDTDPFRLCKVSDFMPVGEVKTRIVYAVNEKKKLSKFAARGPYQILEVIEPGALFIGEITLLEAPPKAGIQKPLNRESLWTAAGFYRQEKAREDQDLTAIDLHFPSVPPNEGVLLRLGRHSGAESVTIAGHRQIKIMQGRGQKAKFEPAATTLWLASDYPKPQPAQRLKLQPFGWVTAAELTAEQAKQLQEMEAACRREELTVTTAAAAGAGPVAAGAVPQPVAPPVQEIWESALLTWNPGNQTITGIWEGKKATVQGKELVPTKLHKRLFAKKKAVAARVTAEPVGNAFRIFKIELLS
jgi:CRISPR-associated protein Csm5